VAFREQQQLRTPHWFWMKLNTGHLIAMIGNLEGAWNALALLDKRTASS
jgi:hypothetical protein